MLEKQNDGVTRKNLNSRGISQPSLRTLRPYKHRTPPAGVNSKGEAGSFVTPNRCSPHQSKHKANETEFAASTNATLQRTKELKQKPESHPSCDLQATPGQCVGRGSLSKPTKRGCPFSTHPHGECPTGDLGGCSNKRSPSCLGRCARVDS